MPDVLVVAPAGSTYVPASRALLREGVEHELTFLRWAESYSEVLAWRWRTGRTFVLVEHDVVPWPGAVHAMLRCPEPWCGYNYPLASGFLYGTLGCVKFGAGILREAPGVAELEGTHWRRLDLAVHRVIENVTGRGDFHVHTPPVAHARERTD